jgi:hypothetical protein
MAGYRYIRVTTSGPTNGRQSKDKHGDTILVTTIANPVVLIPEAL